MVRISPIFFPHNTPVNKISNIEQAANASSTIPTSFVGYGRHLIRTEGALSLYKGLTPFVTHLMTKYCLRYYVNFQLRSLVADENGNTTFFQNLFCGMSAGTIEALMIVTPFEVVKTRLQSQQGSLMPGKKAKYRGPRFMPCFVFFERRVRVALEGM